MTTYKLEIQELLSRVIEIEASLAEEAIDKVCEMYKDEEIMLVDLMYQYNVGIQTKDVYEIKELDNDFFEGE